MRFFLFSLFMLFSTIVFAGPNQGHKPQTTVRKQIVHHHHHYHHYHHHSQRHRRPAQRHYQQRRVYQRYRSNFATPYYPVIASPTYFLSPVSIALGFRF